VIPRIDVLPPAQRRFWDEQIGRIGLDWVLYGGTAVALRLGHRQSVDFDFFSDLPLHAARPEERLPELARATVLLRAPDTLVASVPVGDDEVKLSFFGGLDLGRVGDPDLVTDRCAIASPLDLLATKLKTLHDRIAARDYLDIEALLRSGLSLADGIAAARALFGNSLNPLDTAKATAWFRDGGLERDLPAATRHYLLAAVEKYRPSNRMFRRSSTTLRPRPTP
jgi:hypothetical protein